MVDMTKLGCNKTEQFVRFQQHCKKRRIGTLSICQAHNVDHDPRLKSLIAQIDRHSSGDSDRSCRSIFFSFTFTWYVNNYFLTYVGFILLGVCGVLVCAETTCCVMTLEDCFNFSAGFLYSAVFFCTNVLKKLTSTTDLFVRFYIFNSS